MAKINIGGQAVIEGVMMRSRNNWALAVRQPGGKIAVKEKKIKDYSKKYSFLKWPILRGVTSLIQTTVIGIKAISYSANLSLGEKEKELTTWQLAVTMIFAFGFAMLLFVGLPYFLTSYLAPLKANKLLFSSAEGFIRIGIFIAYIAGISVLRDIKKVFQYHGAEHKIINAYDEGLNPTVENASKFSTVHTSCGTSFLLLVLVIAILVFSLLPVANFGLRVLGKLLVIPLISGISYEIIRFVRNRPKSFLRLFLLPGLLLQKITTKNPDKKQLEVAVAAFNRVVEMELKTK